MIPTFESHVLLWGLVFIVAVLTTVFLEAAARRKPRAPRGGHLWERQRRG